MATRPVWLNFDFFRNDFKYLKASSAQVNILWKTCSASYNSCSSRSFVTSCLFSTLECLIIMFLYFISHTLQFKSDIFFNSDIGWGLNVILTCRDIRGAGFGVVVVVVVVLLKMGQQTYGNRWPYLRTQTYYKLESEKYVKILFT